MAVGKRRAGVPAGTSVHCSKPVIRHDGYVGAGGGEVSSVGSMDWYCSLVWYDYDNDIARLSGNVMKGCLEGKK